MHYGDQIKLVHATLEDIMYGQKKESSLLILH